MKMIVGLGNPGPKFFLTRHNAGFWVIDTFLERHSKEATKKKHNSMYISFEMGGEECFFIKPLSFMNLSGEVVAPWVRELRPDPKEFLVVYDEADLEPGRVQLKFAGGSGGHNGLESIFDHVKSRDFYRLRMGVGKSPVKLLADFVLEPTSKPLMAGLGTLGADALDRVFEKGIDKAISDVNSKAFSLTPAE